MDALKRMLSVIGGGAMLGLVLWGLSTLDAMNASVWIVVGIVLTTAAWMTWGTASLVRARVERANKPEPTIVTQYLRPPSPTEQLRARLFTYSIMYLTSVAFLVLSRSQVTIPDLGLKSFPESISIIIPSALSLTLIATFVVLAALALAASTVTSLQAVVSIREKWLRPIEPFVNILAIMSLVLGWYAAIPLVYNLAPAYVYAYVYFGGVLLLAFESLVVWGWYAPRIRSIASSVSQRLRRAASTA